MRAILLGGLGGLVACGGAELPAETTPTDGPDGACAEPVYFDVAFRGEVTDGGLAAGPGVDVRIEERNWSPGTVHASGVTDADGRFEVFATDLPIIEGCWGWATGFYVVVQRGAGSDEWGVNSLVVGAWQNDEAEVDLRGIVLDVGAR